jgi:hypothetical protein
VAQVDPRNVVLLHSDGHVVVGHPLPFVESSEVLEDLFVFFGFGDEEGVGSVDVRLLVDVRE